MEKKRSKPDGEKKVPAAPGAEIAHFPGILGSHRITLKQIRYFLAVAQNEKVTSAARDIHISPASVTEAVRSLEDTLGVSLFERRRDGMLLTREGDRFRGYCEKILFLLDDALRAVKRNAIIEGDLRIAASPAVQGYFLPSLLSRFRHMFPGVSVSLLELERDEIEKHVIRCEIDIGILLVSNVLDKSKKLQKQKLFSSPRVLWCAATHPLAKQETVSLADISREPYVQLTIDEAEQNTIQFWRQHGIPRPPVILRTKTVEAVRGYVGQGDGVTILSNMLFRPWSLEGDRIVAKPIRESIPTMDVGIIGARSRLSPYATLLFDFLSFYGARDILSDIRKN